jgi:hypothetical protein
MMKIMTKNLEMILACIYYALALLQGHALAISSVNVGKTNTGYRRYPLTDCKQIFLWPKVYGITDEWSPYERASL